MRDLRTMECPKCGTGNRTEEWTVLPDLPKPDELRSWWCDNPKCDDFRVPPVV